MPATWTATFTPLDRHDARAKGVADMVAVTAVSGCRVLKRTLRAADVETWDPEKAWQS